MWSSPWERATSPGSDASWWDCWRLNEVQVSEGRPLATWRLGDWLSRIVTLVGAVLLLTGYWWAPLVLRPMKFFAVRRIEVQGTHYLAPDDVVRAMSLRTEASVFDDLGVLE